MSMRSYTVHVPPQLGWTRPELAAEMVLVPDSFQYLAFLLPPVWFLMRGLWLALLGYLVTIAALEGLFWALSIREPWQLLAGGALHLIIAFEACAIWRWSLERKGWVQVATQVGASVDDCERRFLLDWLSTPSLRLGRT